MSIFICSERLTSRPLGLRATGLSEVSYSTRLPHSDTRKFARYPLLPLLESPSSCSLHGPLLPPSPSLPSPSLQYRCRLVSRLILYLESMTRLLLLFWDLWFLISGLSGGRAGSVNGFTFLASCNNEAVQFCEEDHAFGISGFKIRCEKHRVIIQRKELKDCRRFNKILF